MADPDARRDHDAHAFHPVLNAAARGRTLGTAPLLVLTDRAPRDPAGELVVPGVGLVDDATLGALQQAAARAQGLWLCRAGERHPVVPVRRHLIDLPEAVAHDAGQDSMLWPVYHDLGPGRFDHTWWTAYRAVNSAYAEAAATRAARGATVWVHGHTLQLVPAMLRQHRPDVRIGFFLPTHFPAADTLRILPMHQEVIHGLLGADLLGFQTSAAAEHFLRTTHELTEQPPNVGVYPTSVDTPAITAAVTSPSVVAAAAMLRERLGDPRRVILSINPPEGSQGVEQRLQALGNAFSDGTLDSSDTVVIQVVLGHPGARTATTDGIAQAAARINGQHAAVGRPCVHYVLETPALPERLAYYRAADVLLATPLREGATTAALEFAAAARANAALVLSELSGSASVLPDAYLVNPHDDAQVQAGLTSALADPPEQRESRMMYMRRHVTEYSANTWAATFLRTLRSIERRPRQPMGKARARTRLMRQPHLVQPRP